MKKKLRIECYWYWGNFAIGLGKISPDDDCFAIQIGFATITFEIR